MTKESRFLTLAVFFLSLIAFSIHLNRPGKMVFDEHHYVPAARALISLEPNNNYEHPPLAKFIMGIGTAVSDDAWAWRSMSVVFGALLCAVLFLIAVRTIRNTRWALAAVVLLWLNGFTFVFARVAMLEIFVLTFLSLAWLASLKAEEEPARLQWDLLCGFFLGCAIASKWSALPFLIFAIAWTLFRRRHELPGLQIWSSIAKAYIAVPLAVYALSYIPIVLVGGDQYSPLALIQMQQAMWLTHMQEIPLHSEFSAWWQWPLKMKPMWMMKDYQFPADGSPVTIQTVMLMGNPVVLWLGLAACAALAVFRKSPRYLIMLALALLPWMIPSRSNTFYYYYFPAACIVTLALAAWARDHWTKSWFRGIGYAAFILAAAFFVYNLPLVTGRIMSLSEVLERYPYDLTPPSSR